MKVRVDRKACIGSGDCVHAAPNIFSLDRENKAVIDAQAMAAADEDLLWEAAEACPALAVVLEDDEGSQLYP